MTNTGGRSIAIRGAALCIVMGALAVAKEAHATNFQVPPGVSGTLVFSNSSDSDFWPPTPTEFGIIQRKPSGEATYIALTRNYNNNSGPFHRVPVTGGEVFELFARRNAAGIHPMPPKTYSSDSTKNTVVDSVSNEHFFWTSWGANTWSLTVDLFNYANDNDEMWEGYSSTNAFFDAWIEPTCNNGSVPCPDPNIVSSNHNTGVPSVGRNWFKSVQNAVSSIGPVLASALSVEGEDVYTCVNARIDNNTWNFVQESIDFTTVRHARADGGCGPSDGEDFTGPHFLKQLEIKRFHRPKYDHLPVSSFGFGVFSEFDINLAVYPGASGQESNAVLFDPRSDAPPINFYDTSTDAGDTSVDGAYRDRGNHAYRSLIFYNATGQQEANLRLAAIARLTKHNGEMIQFDIINTQAGNPNPPSLAGRLKDFRDRNNNTFVINYTFARTATDQEMGFDRTRLWEISTVVDMTGATARFSYGRGWTGRLLLMFVQYNNGAGEQFIQYGYSGGSDPDRLNLVSYPNGDMSSFARDWDSGTQTWQLMFNDVAGDGNGQRLIYAYVSGPLHQTPDGVWHNQPAGLIRRVLNGNFERVYQNWEDPRNTNVTYFVEGVGGPGTRLTRLTKSLFGATVEVARSTTAPDSDTNPLSATYAVDESYSPGKYGLSGGTTNAAGETTTVTRNGDGSIATVTRPDGKTTTTTLDANQRVTRQVDALGVVSVMTYNSAGNLLTTTTASGTPRAQIWRYAYNSKGLMTSLTNPLNVVTNYAYDTAGRLLSVTDPSDAVGGVRPVRSFEYDVLSRRKAEVDAAGRRTTFAYDVRGRLVTTTYPDQTTETTTYGTDWLAGVKVLQKNRNGVLTDFFYDSTRRLTEQASPSDGPTRMRIMTNFVPGRYLVSDQTAEGTRTENRYDTQDRLIEVKTYATNETTLTYKRTWDSADRVTVETDPENRRTFYVYDANGRTTRKVWELVPGGVTAGANISTLARITTANPAYVIVDQAYDALGRMTSQTNERGFIKTTAYDELGRQIQTVEASGTPRARTKTFQYDAANNLTSEVGPRSTTAYTYTRRNLPASKTDASGRTEAATTRKTYTLTGAVATTTDARGGVTTLTHAAANDYVVSATDPGGFLTTMTYDAMGFQLSRTDANAVTQRYLYDPRNRKVRDDDGLGQATFQDYDDDLQDGVGLDAIAMYAAKIAELGFGGSTALGHAMRVTNPANGTSLVVSDGLGRKVLEFDALGNATRTSYGTVTNGLSEIKVTNALGKVVTLRHDGSTKTREKVDPDGNVTRHTYDASGNLLSTRDANGTGMDCLYDELNRRTSCTSTAGDKTSWVYDSDGNVTSTTDPNGNTSTCQYDARNRKTSCTNRVGGVTSYTYDANSNVLTERDTQNGTTTYTYDARNLRLTTTYPDSSSSTDKVTNTYDAGRRIQTTKDQSGNTLTMTYDGANRLKKVTYPGGQSDTYTYDAASRITSATSEPYSVTTDRSYDAAGRLTSETTSHPLLFRSTVGYAYDSASRVTKLTYPDSSQVTHVYGLNRDLITEVKRGTFSVGRYAYDAASRRTSTTFGNSLVETRSFLANDNHVSQMSTPQVGTLIYTYDKNKNKLTETGTAASGNQTFGYDKEDRLTSFAGPSLNQSWTLSGEGDWTSTTRNTVVENRTHNAAHELTAVGAASLTYDARGNMTRDNNSNNLVWDFTNRLKQFQKSGGPTVDYFYDAFGRKVGRKVGTSTVTYVFGGDNVIAEYTNNTLTTTYIFGPRGVDDYLAYVNGGVYRWYSRDPLGTVKAVTNEGGVVSERYRYSAYGERTILSSTGTVRSATTVANFIGFTGRPHDVDTGLVDFRSRQYQPRLGRFISRDAKGYISGHSLYRGYFAPNATDPTGHAPWDALIDLGRDILDTAGDAADVLGGVANAAINAVMDAPGAALGLAGDIGNAFLNGARFMGTELWNGTKYLASAAWGGLSNIASSIGDGAGWLYGQAARGVDHYWDDLMTNLAPVAAAFVDVKNTFELMLHDLTIAAWKVVTGHPKDAFKSFVNFMGGVVNVCIVSVNFGLIAGSFVGNFAKPMPGQATLIGVTLGLIGWAATGFEQDGTPNILWANGGLVFEFPNNYMSAGGPPARTLGKTIFYSGNVDADTRRHELQHTKQYGILGEHYVETHAAAGLFSLMTTSTNDVNGAWHEHNWLEWGPSEDGNDAWTTRLPRIPRW